MILMRHVHTLRSDAELAHLGKNGYGLFWTSRSSEGEG